MSQPKKTIVVTGANGGLGLAVVERLLSEGHRVWGHYHSRPESLARFPEDRFKALRADLTEPAAAGAMIERISAVGPIDALVNLVGPFEKTPLAELTPMAWQRDLTLNLNTAFNTIYAARGALLRSRGHIVNFTYAGVENIKALPEATAYAAAKAGLLVLTKSLAKELAKEGVRVNAVAPGWMMEVGREGARGEEIAQNLPSGRLGNPEEVAEVVDWLLNRSPAYLTGANIAVGGAWEF